MGNQGVGGGDGGAPADGDGSGPTWEAYDAPVAAAAADPLPENATPAATSRFAGTGLWIAKPSDDVTIQLALMDDGSFVWTTLSNGSASGFRGTYRMDGNHLIFAANDKQMAGTVSGSSSRSFNFIVDNSDAGDTGLAFAR